MSTFVSQMAWRIKTQAWPGSGTDSPVTITVLRDGEEVFAVNIEPGYSNRLERGTSTFVTLPNR